MSKKVLITISALIFAAIVFLFVCIKNEPYFSPPNDTGKETSSTSSPATTSPPETVDVPETTEAPPAPIPTPVEKYDPIDMSGTVSTSTGTSLALVIEWSAKRSETEKDLSVRADVYLEHHQLYIKQKDICSVSINGESEDFICPAISEGDPTLHRTLLHSISRVIEYNDTEPLTLEFEAKMYIGAYYSNTQIDVLHAKGSALISDEILSLPQSAKLDVKAVMQNPGLPQGCEITSLTALLNYFGFDVDKLTMCEKYLDIGPVGSTSYYEANIGDPRSDYSYGCYSPVIYNSAEEFLRENEASYKAVDLTGHDISEIYAQIADGKPVVVWMTMYINVAPYNIKSFVIGDKTIYWKHPLHCVVLSGYDKEAGKVYVADPLTGNVSHDMSLFELRWRQMGAQAITLDELPAF